MECLKFTAALTVKTMLLPFFIRIAVLNMVNGGEVSDLAQFTLQKQ